MARITFIIFAGAILLGNIVSTADAFDFNKLKQGASKIFKDTERAIEKAVKKTADKSDDTAERDYEESHSGEYRYDYDNKEGIKLISTINSGKMGHVRLLASDGGAEKRTNRSINHLPSKYFFLAYIKHYPQILEDERVVSQYFSFFYEKEYNAYRMADTFERKRIVSEWADRIKAESASAPTTFQFFLQSSISGNRYDFKQHFFPVSNTRIGYNISIPCSMYRPIPITVDKQFTLEKLSFSDYEAEKFLKQYSDQQGNIDIFISFTMTLKGKSNGGGLTARVDNFRGHTSKEKKVYGQRLRVGPVFREWSLKSPGDAVVKSSTIPHGREKDGEMSGGASFETAHEPDYRTLFKMYMASQGDILDTEALALEYHLLFRVEPGLPGGTWSAECKQINNMFDSRNDFEIKDLINRIRPPFRQALLDARDWPKTKVFRLKGSVSFGEYDREKRMFPFPYNPPSLDQEGVQRRSGSSPLCTISSYRGDGSSMLPNIRLAVSGLEKIKSLPMEEARARSILEKLTDKRRKGIVNKTLDIEVLVQVGPVPFANELRRGGGGIPARITAARLLYPNDNKVIHTYSTSLFETTSGTKVDNLAGTDDAVPLTTMSAALLVLREHPQLIEDDWALRLVKDQIVSEQWRWKTIDGESTGRDALRNVNKKRHSFIYEWQTLDKEQSNLAMGPVLDVFWQAEPDWSFVKQEKEWDDRLKAIVSVFLFSRDKIKGRDPDFLARELLPVWRRHLDAILAKKPPERMRMSGFFAEPKYDFNTQSLQLVPHYKTDSSSSSPDLFAPIVNPVFEVPEKGRSSHVLPKSAQKSGLYWLAYEKSKTTNPSSFQYHGADTWRRSIAPTYGGPLSTWRNPPMRTTPQVLALDRRLELTSIPVAKSKAEELLEKIRHASQKNNGRYSIEARLFFEPVRTELGSWVPFNLSGTTSKPLPVLFGRVIRVDLLMADGQLITSLGPDDFPSAGEANAADFAKAKAGELQKQDARAKRKAEIERKQEPMKRARKEVDNQIAKCSALATAEECLQCLENLRDSVLVEILKESGLLKDSSAKGTPEYEEAMAIATRAFEPSVRRARKGTPEYKVRRAPKSTFITKLDNKINKARQQMKRDESKAQSEERDLRRSCEQNLSSKLWAPRRGTLEFEEAVVNYLKAPKRETYGPDIVDLRLGMESRTANEIVQKRMQSRNNTMLHKETRPFDSGTLNWTDDASRGIALFFIKNHDRDLVAAVSRRTYFGDKGATADQITEGLRKKYGTETWSDGKKTMVWAFPTGPEHLSRKGYSGLAELLAPRDNWPRKWVKRLTDQERAQAMQKKQEERMAKANALSDCMMEASIKAQPYERNNAKYMKILNKEMKICNEKYGFGGINSYQTKSVENTRLPLMIGPEGDPETYAKYEKCGPVIITHLNTNKKGKVMDASFVLFDPAWIASQPAFFFKSVNEGTNKMIDF